MCILMVTMLSGCGCGSSHSPPGVDGSIDAGLPDTGIDAGATDAGLPDTGIDAGATDAGLPDTGIDAGATDAGPPACPSTHGDCDGVWENGCEVDLRVDPESCGACGDACEPGETCDDGLCDNERVVDMAVAAEHMCVVRSSGALDCWGDNEVGQVGDGTTIARSVPTRVMDDADTVDASAIHTCALDRVGDAWCWGFAGNGALGTESPDDPLTPTIVSIDGPFDQLAAGASPTCEGACVVRSGSLTCWGSPTCGLRPDDPPYWLPVDLTEPTNVTQVFVGFSHNCAIRDAGDVWCWGENRQGQLGRGTVTPEDEPPAAVIGLADVVHISKAGDLHTCAIRTDGSAWCWGRNSDGQLGDGTYIDSAAPVAAEVPPSVTYLIGAAGLAASCAVDSMGGVWCWGDNEWGQLGDGTLADSLDPQPVPGIDDAVDVEFGSSMACALHESGAVSCWGGMHEGAVVSSPSPVTVIGLR